MRAGRFAEVFDEDGHHLQHVTITIDYRKVEALPDRQCVAMCHGYRLSLCCRVTIIRRRRTCSRRGDKVEMSGLAHGASSLSFATLRDRRIDALPWICR